METTKEIVKMRIESMSRPIDIFPRVLPHQHSWLNTYGNNFLFWRGSRAQLVISVSELVKEILNNKEKAYLKTETEGYLKKLFGDAFASSYLEGKDIFEMLMKLIVIFFRNGLKSRLPGLRKSSNDIESEKLEQRIRDRIIRMMNKRVKVITEVDNLGRTDLLGLLVEANKNTDENDRLMVQDEVDECKTFYIAGHETTTTLLSWTVLLLSIHTDWQDKAREEVLELFGQKHPNAESIARMKTVHNALFGFTYLQLF
ncbi:hypothetical protein Acr_12g0009670 [Actinidia rufa]|uniref:Uncharacterized protein n=1 Tax=Actinidia rufa TaxID=165716 RepID=A0A7J0FJ11_9ERIC|nr:hypothetical protein Acr_12g0009670 [Actinidia rufa]